MPNHNYNDYSELPLQSINEPHMPALLLLDNSGSLAYRNAIQHLNSAVNRFASDVCKDPKAAECVDVAVVSFNSEPTVVQNWCPITEMAPINLQASGGTDLNAALRLGNQMCRERAHLYEDVGTEVKTPWIILVTDGQAANITDIANEIKQRTAAGKMKLWVLAVGDADEKTLQELTNGGERLIFMEDGSSFDFSTFFNFMAVSIKAVSTSAPGERAKFNFKFGTRNDEEMKRLMEKWMND